MTDPRATGAGPVRIDQVVHVLAARDAIGAHVLHTAELLRSSGFRSEIYAGSAQPEVASLARPLEELERSPAEERWLLVHHSTGAAAATVAARRPEPVVLDYHNVTPPELIDGWLPDLVAELELGLEQLDQLAGRAVFGIAHSEFSRLQLEKAGCRHSAVAAPLVDLGTLGAEVDAATVARLQAGRASGGSDWLFVGRVSPHKAPHDLVKALACHRQCYGEPARLHLVGSGLGEDYPRALARYCERLGLAEDVELAGSVTPAALASYYACADVFVCASDHEGFCVPLVEAMHQGLPVVAFGSSAVAETVADGGLVLADKSPMTLATAVHRVLGDSVLRSVMSAAARRRAAHFGLERAGRRMAAALQEAVAAGGERRLR